MTLTLYFFSTKANKSPFSQKKVSVDERTQMKPCRRMTLFLDPLLLSLRTRKIFYAARKRASSRLTHSWLVSLKAMLYYNFFVFSSLLTVGYAAPRVLACSRCCRSMVMMIIIILRPAGCCFLQMTRRRHFLPRFLLARRTPMLLLLMRERKFSSSA